MTLYDQKFGSSPRLPAKAVEQEQKVSPRPEESASTATLKPRRRAGIAYWALLSFSFLYYARPEDFIPGLQAIPVGKISGGIALLALLLSWNKQRAKMPLEIKLVIALFLWMCLTVPVAFWRGGALDVVMNQCSKAAITALLISMIVNSLAELRRLLWVQAASIALMTAQAIAVYSGGASRMLGVGGAFSNPNDLAINIAINFPLALAFMLGAKGTLRKLIWMGAVLAMLYGVIATYSRSGFLALVVCFIICIWEFGIKGRRMQIVAAAILMLTLGVGFALVKPRYTHRLATIVGGDIKGTGDKGSMEARRELLNESIDITLKHPLFGVGPGNFQAYTQSWHVTHNTYTELSSEAGIPALALFLTILGLSFRNLHRARKLPGFKAEPQLQLFNNALWAGLSAYMVGALFASTAYSLFPYFMVAYASALYKITSATEVGNDKHDPPPTLKPRNTQKPYGKQERALAWTR